MNKLKDFIKSNQQKLVITVGYVLVAFLGLGLGRVTQPKPELPPIRVEASTSPLNYTPNEPNIQSTCQGQIKGSSSMIYHVPGGSFYDKTTKPINCFDTEAQAQAAGFRKSSK